MSEAAVAIDPFSRGSQSIHVGSHEVDGSSCSSKEDHCCIGLRGAFHGQDILLDAALGGFLLDQECERQVPFVTGRGFRCERFREVEHCFSQPGVCRKSLVVQGRLWRSSCNERLDLTVNDNTACVISLACNILL